MSEIDTKLAEMWRALDVTPDYIFASLPDVASLQTAEEMHGKLDLFGIRWNWCYRRNLRRLREDGGE